MKTIATFSFLLLFFIGCSASKDVLQIQPGKQIGTQFEKEVTIKVKSDYLIYLPENYISSKENFPLVMFLHGSGERGTDINLVKRHGPPKLVEQGKQFPFILVSPQCPDKIWWDVRVLSALLDEVESLYRVDKKRIYLTGLSMGGYGTWSLAMEEPDRFAAIAPICGGGDPDNICVLKNVPVWAFHGAKDNVVPLKEEEAMVEALKSSGGNVKFTIYPDAGHNSWTETYDNPEFYEWLLSKTK